MKLFILFFISQLAFANGDALDRYRTTKVERILRLAKDHRDPLVKELVELLVYQYSLKDADELDEMRIAENRRAVAERLKFNTRKDRAAKLQKMVREETGLQKEIVNQLLDVD